MTTEGVGGAVYLAVTALVNIGIIIFLIITAPTLLEALAITSWAVLSGMVGLVWWAFGNDAV